MHGAIMKTTYGSVKLRYIKKRTRQKKKYEFYDENFGNIWEFLETWILNISHDFSILFNDILSLNPDTKSLVQDFALYIYS